jgi:hypothetical protein
MKRLSKQGCNYQTVVREIARTGKTKKTASKPQAQAQSRKTGRVRELERVGHGSGSDPWILDTYIKDSC